MTGIKSDSERQKLSFCFLLENIKNNASNSLFKNSLYLMLTTLFGSGSGFFFWIIAANLYSTKEVGLAVAIISAMSLLSMFARLGFDIGIIRYLPTASDKKEMINSSLTIISISSIAFSIIFLMGIDIFSPTLSFLKENILYTVLFIVFTLFNSVLVTQNNIFAALRHSEYSLMQTLIAMLRILLLPAFLVYGLFGMYFSYGIGILVASVIGNNLITRVHVNYKPKPLIQVSVLKKIFTYSTKNYISTLFEGAPVYILPLLIVHMLGAEKNAYFYIAWSFFSFILMIPRATAMSLFAEGSNEQENIRKNTISSIKFIFLLLVPTILTIFLFGRFILLAFGEGYSENALELLKILSISSIPFALNAIYITTKRIKGQIEPIIYFNLFIGIFSIIFSYILIKWIGLSGVGVAWLFVNSIAAIFIVGKILKTYEINY